MDKFGKWETIGDLGNGGQGKVYLARDTNKFNKDQRARDIATTVAYLSHVIKSQEDRWALAEQLARQIGNFSSAEDPANLGALKVLHKLEGSQEAKQAETRIKREMEALSKTDHPNILKILDRDSKGKWFVGEYHAGLTLSKNLHLFRGNLLAALEAFRPLVEGVSALHEAGLIHRDVKPDNIFIAKDGRLVLGDLGLIFFADQEHRRVSTTFENVGSWQWMPPWAALRRLDKIRPVFDIFGLGKVLWTMVAGEPSLPFWYFDREEFNLEKKFPGNPEVKWAREIFMHTIVENEENCIATSNELLERVDTVISAVRRHANVVKEGIVRPCNICGLGEYEYTVNENNGKASDFGIQPSGMSAFKIFACNYCGHVQMFYISDVEKKRPAAWKKE